MSTEDKNLMVDVMEAGQSIRARCAGHSFEEYLADRWFRRAVEREFEIIGEALNRLERRSPGTAGHGTKPTAPGVTWADFQAAASARK